MAIDRTFAGSLQKAVRSLEIKRTSLDGANVAQRSDEEIWKGIEFATDERLFFVVEGIRRGFTVREIVQRTAIDQWFVEELRGIVRDEEWILQHPSNWTQRIRELKQRGFSDHRIGELTNKTEDEIRTQRIKLGVLPSYKMVDTCAGEFPAQTPYYYATYEDENEAEPLAGPKILVIGSGPIRIGQGIEFDAASVYALNALKKLHYQAIMVNNNPETVSTDFNASDRLYFEPITLEDVLNIIDWEKPDGVVVQFGGQTAINLAESLTKHGVRIIGTNWEGLQAAEDRELFDRLGEQLGIKRPPGLTVTTIPEALAACEKIGFPLLVRPSYVLGGRAMKIVEDFVQLQRYLKENHEMGISQPLLMDRYMNGLELEVDVVSDGHRVVIPAVMEHVERAGVHSGDSLAVLPPVKAQQTVIDQVVDISVKLCRGIGVKGLLNIQFVAVDNQVYVIEANPRSSRTVPFVIKATGVPLVDLAMEAGITGHFDERWGEGLLTFPDYFSVKMPVFSFAKLGKVDAILDPEMKSTGEVMGIDRDFSSALYKALIAGGFRVPGGGRILVTIADADKQEALPYLRELADLGYRLYATQGTLAMLSAQGIPATPVYKLRDRRPHLVDLIHQGQFDLVINTITVGGDQEREGFLIRRAAVEQGILCFTSLDTVQAAIEALKGRQRQTFSVHPLNEWLRVGQVR